MTAMKKWIKICYVLLLLILLVADGSHSIDEMRIIGTKFDVNALPYGKRGLWSRTVVNGISYKAHGAFYRNRILVYVYDNSNTIIYFYASDFICYAAAANMPTGKHYEDVIYIFGTPVTKNYIENPNVGYHLELMYMPLFTSFYQWREVLRGEPLHKLLAGNRNHRGFSLRLSRRGIYMRTYAIAGMGLVFLFDENYKLRRIAMVRTGVA